MPSEDTVVEEVTPLSGQEAGETYLTPSAPLSVMPEPPRKRLSKKWILIALLAVVVLLALILSLPQMIYAWNHVSTDDAIVNGHVTYISSRVVGVAQDVLVDDNQFVDAGTPMVRIDSVPYQLAVDQKEAELARAKLSVAQEVAALDLANAQLNRVRSEVRSKIASLRGDWYLVATVQDFVKYETAALQANAASLREKQADLRLAQQEFDRVEKLGPQSVSVEEIDLRRSAVQVAQAQVASAEATLDQTRALLGIGTDQNNPASVPADVAQTFNGTQYALSTFLGEFAQLGLDMPPMSLAKLQQMKERFASLDYSAVIENSPPVKAAKAQVESALAALGGDHFDRAHPELQPEIVAAQKSLDQAQLQLGYTDIRAPLAGYVSRRNVNPGAFVAVGQPLLTIRPLSDVWIDANFKETQLEDLRIGQKVDLYVDAYSGKVFHGRVAGFSPGTGAVMSLLPPENATGNFVKVVQRLPVRIELTEPNPKDTPLFAGLSVDPEVDIRSQPGGPDAGQRLLSARPSAGSAEPMSAAIGAIPITLERDQDREFNPWIIALTVTLSTFMEVLDTSIANLSLPHIAGSMAATIDEATWVLTSYLVANAVILPLSGWLTLLLGRKRFNMTCVLVFTLSSALCGMATSLPMLICFRILQGIGGGGLQPSVQAILLDTFPVAKRGMAMAVYTIAVLVAPVLGPTLGGWITDSYSWRWIFYLNVPVGAFSLLLTQIVLRDPPYLIAQRAARRAKPFHVDFVGLGIIAIGLASLEVVLDKGQESDWFSSKFIVSLSIIAVAALIIAVVWELRQASPIVNLRLFAERNFMLSSIICFAVYATLYASTVLLPQMLQTLMGYSATKAGLVLSPAGLVTMLEMPLIGWLLSRGVDARKMIALGLFIAAAAAAWMSRLNLQVSEADVIWPRIVQVLGAGMMFVPINTIAYRFIPRTETNNASGLFSLIRNEGSSIGVALVTTLLARHTQVHQARLASHITLLNPAAVQMMQQTSGLFGPNDPTGGRGALAMIYALVQQQAAILSYLDLFQMFAIITLLVIPLVFFMRRPGASRDALMAH